ncbi:hypothetical protein GCM10018987_69270 [Streptomyces cremeus]
MTRRGAVRQGVGAAGVTAEGVEGPGLRAACIQAPGVAAEGVGDRGRVRGLARLRTCRTFPSPVPSAPGPLGTQVVGPLAQSATAMHISHPTVLCQRLLPCPAHGLSPGRAARSSSWFGDQ